MDGDKSGESGAFLFSRRVPDFWDGRRSFATNGNTNMYRSGTSAMDFAHYQSPKLLGSSSPITNKHGATRKHEWESGTDFWRLSDLLYTYWEILTREKSDTCNQNRERCFFTCEKNDTSNQKPQMCLSFAPKFPPFLAACWAQLRTHSRRKVFL